MFAQQGQLFGGFGDGRDVEVRLQSADFDALLATARAAPGRDRREDAGRAGAQLPGGACELSERELFVPDDRRITSPGWTRAEVATVVRALGDGVWVRRALPTATAAST